MFSSSPPTLSRCVSIDSLISQDQTDPSVKSPLAKLRLIQLPVPCPLPPKSILIRVLAVSVDHYDLGLLHNQPPINLTKLNMGILGRSGAGKVIGIGEEDGHGLRPGDRVYFAQDLKCNGTYQEFLTIESRFVARSPKNLTDLQAASLPLDCLTLYIALNEKAALTESRPVQSILLSRADHPQGLGPLAVQYCRDVLCIETVYVTLYNPNIAPKFLDLGAIPCKLSDLHPDYLDVVLSCSPLTPELFDSFCRLVKPNGKIVSLRSSKHPLRMPNDFPFKSCTLAFELLFTHVMFGDYPDTKGEILSLFTSYIEQGLLWPIVRSWPDWVTLWADHNAVHAFADGENSVFGKLVVSCVDSESPSEPRALLPLVSSPLSPFKIRCTSIFPSEGDPLSDSP